MQFYDSFFIGSDFLNKKSSLPSFSVKKIFNSFDIPIIETSSKLIDKKKLTKFFRSKKSSALIVNTKYSEIIKTYKKICNKRRKLQKGAFLYVKEEVESKSRRRFE